MKKSYLESVLEQLNEKDIYSLLLFVLYKLKDDKKYSTLSELAYALDKNSFYNLLSIFGGLTITIPTVKDMRLVVSGLLIYQLVNLEERDLTTAITSVSTGEYSEKELKDVYLMICEVMKDYDIKNRK